ncbi:hypothetical protein [Limosilactobacillus reuteri]|uniref:hypothetical protein n=1 Tax=Limosilactobacillus reuteri TaxID=1598 RepID=UPI003F1E4BF8
MKIVLLVTVLLHTHLNTYKAECNLVGNWSLLKEALAITEVFLFTQTITTKNTVGVFV